MRRIFTIVLLLVATPIMAAGFKDIPDNHWAKKAVDDLVQAGVIGGYADGTFRGEAQVNRYQLSVVLYQLKEMLANQNAARGTSNVQAAAPVTNFDADTLKATVDSLQFKVELLSKELEELKKQSAPAAQN